MNSRKVRFIIFLIAAGIFVVGAPLLVLHSAGYRYNFDSGTIQRTGSLYIETEPKKVTATLNGKIVNEQNPVRLDTLLPGTYRIELSRPGWHSWQKDIEIKRNLTTFVKGTQLFRQTLPQQIISGKIGRLKKINGENRIIFTRQLEQRLEFVQYNISTGQEQIPYTTDANVIVNNIIIAPNNQKIILLLTSARGREVKILNTLNGNLADLSSGNNQNWEIVKFHQNDTNIFYAFGGGILYRVNIDNDKAEKILSANILDLVARDQTLYYITKMGASPFIVRTTVQDPAAEDLIRLPLPPDFTFEPSPDGFLLLSNKSTHDFFLIGTDIFNQPDINDKTLLSGEATNFAWSENNVLTYHNDFEIYQYQLSQQQNELVNRYGEIVAQVLPYPKSSNVIYTLANQKLKIVDKNTQGGVNDITLAEFDFIDQLLLNNAADTLYFVAKIGNQQGIYQLEIK